jgi:hypothetical protein
MTVRTNRARDELGWRPVVDRAAGLAELRGMAAIDAAGGQRGAA